MVETGTYLYAISQDPVDIAEPGVTDTTVRPLHTAGLVVQVSPLITSVREADGSTGTERVAEEH